MPRAVTCPSELTVSQGVVRRTRWLAYSVLGLAIAAVFLLELTLGPVRIAVSDVVAALTGSVASSDVIGPIELHFRLPRAFNALISGAALGACGLILQTVFRNPLADPFILGVICRDVCT